MAEQRLVDIEVALQHALDTVRAAGRAAEAAKARARAAEARADAAEAARRGDQGVEADRPPKLVDTRVLGKPRTFDEMEANWKQHRFTMTAYAGAISPPFATLT